jgi:hypothetical protein
MFFSDRGLSPVRMSKILQNFEKSFCFLADKKGNRLKNGTT